MYRQPAKRSSLFLLELILAILCFCLTAAVCVRLFVTSYTTAQASADLSHAVHQAGSVAEILRSDEDVKDCLQKLYPDGEADESSFFIYYDRDWSCCDRTTAAYILEVDWSTESSMRRGNIRVFAVNQDSSIYTLDIEKYLQREVDGHETA